MALVNSKEFQDMYGDSIRVSGISCPENSNVYIGVINHKSVSLSPSQVEDLIEHLKSLLPVKTAAESTVHYERKVFGNITIKHCQIGNVADTTITIGNKE